MLDREAKPWTRGKREIVAMWVSEEGAKAMLRERGRIRKWPRGFSKIPASIAKPNCSRRGWREEDALIISEKNVPMITKEQGTRAKILSKYNFSSSQAQLHPCVSYWSKPSSQLSRSFLWELALRPTQDQQVQAVHHAAMQVSISIGWRIPWKKLRDCSELKSPKTL